MTDYKSIKYNISGADLTGIPTSAITSGTFADARISSGSVTQHVTSTDLQPVKADITALALREATNEASAAFNLPHSFIDTFATDVLGTKTNADVLSGYVGTITDTTNYGFPMGAYNSDMTISSGGWTSSITNDELSSSASYIGGYPDYLFDLSKDFRVRLYYTNNSGSLLTHQYGIYSGFVTTDTSATAGLNPSQFNNATTTNLPHPNLSPANMSNFLESSYYSTIGMSGATDNYNNAANSRQTVSCASGSIFHCRGYAGANARYGVDVDYDKDNNQITISFQTGTTFGDHTDTTKRGGTIFTNVPTTGRFGMVFGHDESASDRCSGTYSNADNTVFGFYKTGTANATGTIIQAANAVTGSRTKVGGTFLYKDNEGTATLGSANDLAIYFTCNGGTNWTEAAGYTAITPVYSTGIKQVRLSETTCTGGTDVRYKAVWANQSAGSKETQLHGIGINY